MDEKLEAWAFFLGTVLFILILALLPKASAEPIEPASDNLIRIDSAKRATKLITHFEGFSPRCTDILDGHATIGYGRLMHFGPCTDADNSIFMTEPYAEKLLLKDIKQFDRKISSLIQIDIGPNQKIALISFAYNVGINAFAGSSLLEFLNQGRFHLARDEFSSWVYGSGAPLPGLIRRRQIEKSIFGRDI